MGSEALRKEPLTGHDVELPPCSRGDLLVAYELRGRQVRPDATAARLVRLALLRPLGVSTVLFTIFYKQFLDTTQFNVAH